MSFVPNRALQITDSDGNPVDITSDVRLPIEEEYTVGLLQELIKQQRLTNTYLAAILGADLGGE